MTNREILEMARQKAQDFGEPAPRTVEDVERLAGFVYTGPDPEAIGVTQYPVVQTWG